MSRLGQPLSWRRDQSQAQLLAMAAEGDVAHYYGKGAASYQCSILDRDGPQLMGQAIDHFVQDVSAQLRLMPQPLSLLDLGSATGQPGFNLARTFPAAEVTGRHPLPSAEAVLHPSNDPEAAWAAVSDISAGMVEAAQQTAEQLGIRNVQCLVVDAEDLSRFKDNAFSAITCSAAIFFVPDWKRWVDAV